MGYDYGDEGAFLLILLRSVAPRGARPYTTSARGRTPVPRVPNTTWASASCACGAVWKDRGPTRATQDEEEEEGSHSLPTPVQKSRLCRHQEVWGSSTPKPRPKRHGARAAGASRDRVLPLFCVAVNAVPFSPMCAQSFDKCTPHSPTQPNPTQPHQPLPHTQRGGPRRALLAPMLLSNKIFRGLLPFLVARSPPRSHPLLRVTHHLRPLTCLLTWPHRARHGLATHQAEAKYWLHCPQKWSRLSSVLLFVAHLPHPPTHSTHPPTPPTTYSTLQLTYIPTHLIHQSHI